MTPMKINYRDGLVVHDVQKEWLGRIGIDEFGYRWSYVRFMANINAGEHVEDQATDDLLSAATGTVTAAQAAGTKRLQDTGEFAGDDFVGAFLATLGDTVANGAGQGGYISKMIDDDEIELEVLHGDADPRTANTNWETALTTSTTYSLWFPGRVKLGTAVPALTRGVPQVDVTGVAAATPKFGWVKQTGPAWVKVDVSADALVKGELIIPAASGLWKGHTAAGTTADEVALALGQCIFGDVAGAVDALTMANLWIPNCAVSMRPNRRDNPYNEVTIQ